ncbi:hypothetical protein V1509DRAFT_612400 [Lipomyces kononenkoae]
MNGIVKHLSHHNPESLDGIVDAGSSDVRGSSGGYEHSVKQADGLFQYIGPGAGRRSHLRLGSVRTMILFSVTRICGSKAVTLEPCVLMCLNESPRFRNAIGPVEDIGDVEAEKKAMICSRCRRPLL